MNQPRRIVRAYWLSVVTGAYAGIILQILATTLGTTIDPSEFWGMLPIVVLSYGLFALPFVALGLALFGLPVAGLLRRRARGWWVGVLAVVWGGLAGKLMFYAIDHLMFFGPYDPREVMLIDLGVIYGVPTGLAWWLFCRRSLSET